MNISRREFLQLTASGLALSALSVKAEEGLTIWGPPVSPTVLLAVASQMGEARKIRPFQVKSWKSPDELRAGLVNKSIQMSIVPCYVAANLRAQGQKVHLYNIMTNGLLYVISKGEKISAFKELSGQKIITAFKNDMPDLAMQILAKANQTDLSQLDFVGTPPETVMMFLQKDYPFALLPEPLASAAILRGKQLGVEVQRCFALHDQWNSTFNKQHGLLMAGLLVSEEALQQHGEFLNLLNQDLKNAVEWVKNNPQSAAELASGYMPAPVPALEQALAYSSLTATRSTDIADELLFFLNELHALNPKITGGKPADASLFG